MLENVSWCDRGKWLRIVSFVRLFTDGLFNAIAISLLRMSVGLLSDSK